MKTAELPASIPAAVGAGPKAPGLYTQTARRIVERFTYPAEKPFITLVLYYSLLIGLGALIYYFVPDGYKMISGQRLQDLKSAPGLSDPQTGPAFAFNLSLSMALAMLGAFLLMLPASWVYMATRRAKGFDQQVVQTIIILAVSVSGVVIIARNSVALAFSLAGVVGAVRFRNTLPETRDTLYIFLSIGVGLAAGVEALTAALVLSMIFNFIVLLMHRSDYGMCELGGDPRRLLVGCDMSAGKNGNKGEKAEKKKAKGFNAVLLVRAKDTDQARPVVEAILGTEVPRFRLAEIEATSKGKGVLKYLIRLNKRIQPSLLEDALLERASPNVIGARIH